MIRKFLNVSILIFIIAAFYGVFGQSSNSLSRRCPGLTPSPENSIVEITKVGRINIVPCSGQSVFINGSSTAGLITSLNGLTTPTQTFATPTANDTASWSSATSTHTLRLPITAVSGSSRSTYFPYFDAANTFAKSPFSWNGTTYNFRNTALNNTFQFSYTPHSTDGLFSVGNALVGLEIDQSAQQINLDANGQTSLTLDGDAETFTLTAPITQISSPTFSAGDVNGEENVTLFTIVDSSLEINAEFANQSGIFTVANGRFRIDSSQTPASAAAACSVGQIAWDANFIYVCIAINTWKRSAIATW